MAWTALETLWNGLETPLETERGNVVLTDRFGVAVVSRGYFSVVLSSVLSVKFQMEEFLLEFPL